ncbi:hypothetical protein PSEUBRA_001226 [Kalmanozyma brasiliensis GHG001]|uniref:uncharacterized protein n=1 Tax=Kalmanozyma brasiliensis (strain GHG001) TaxID=1365824 RepID=UPI002867DA02|nr:uncharacterized protein PSEUBRA_001226 [Kalmanozyma brasiliensis GHG001]KAF6766906.1 hypothetical protein PSEUBRA_001226 [Kalmanozyma brasiliensis GHG001]
MTIFFLICLLAALFPAWIDAVQVEDFELKCQPFTGSGGIQRGGALGQGGQFGSWVKRSGAKRGDTFGMTARWDKNFPNAPFYCVNDVKVTNNPDESNFVWRNGDFETAYLGIGAENSRMPERKFQHYLLSNDHIALVLGDREYNATFQSEDSAEPFHVVRKLSPAEVQQMADEANQRAAVEASQRPERSHADRLAASFVEYDDDEIVL